MSLVEDIDDSLYSRQRYVLGDGAMQKLAQAKVLIIGLGGVGVEVAKNVILAGVKSVTLCDNQQCCLADLGTQFFLRQEDVDNKLLRASACCSRLAELNPYVSVSVSEEHVLDHLEMLSEFQCVVVSGMLFADQIEIDRYCRSQQPAIPFISCDVHGLFSYLFCDFGDEFVVHDNDGEEFKEVFISSITKGHPTVIETLSYKRHGLETGDKVAFKEIKGMTQLNEQIHTITYINPSSFSIDLDTSANEYSAYIDGGVFTKVKVPTKIVFSPLETQITSPNMLINDLSKLESPSQSLIGIVSMHRCMKNSNKMKEIQLDRFLTECENVNKQMKSGGVDQLDVKLLSSLARSFSGKLAPLCAGIGGIAAQEVLIGLSGKFSPLKQWLLLDAVELCDNDNSQSDSVNLTLGHSDNTDLGQDCRYSQLLKCLSPELVDKIQNSKLFMVGCGAIGCEMLKNYALLGVGSGVEGVITITDNDLIEKSNLNRQFLFRPWHIQKSKAITAAESAKEINPNLKIQAHQNKVCPETQTDIYNDGFYQKQDVIVNALDNVEARRYVDGRCVSNQKPLLETGTMGPKGHVQVVVPFLTESYSDQRDPVDEDVPYCTLKSFPQIIEHTIQWARDKFESLFNLKPTTFNKFWEVNGSPILFKEKMTDGSHCPDGFVDSVSLLQKSPTQWSDCVSLARVKFEMYFNHKAKQLLHVFPLDTVQSDGTLFWQSPKRPPKPIEFCQENETHMLFVKSFACLTANVHNIQYKDEDLENQMVVEILKKTVVPEFVPSNKKIETDETQDAKDTSSTTTDLDADKITLLTNYLKSVTQTEVKDLRPEHFEKDDDSNHHIDFITAASNLRATMYNIETADRYKTKRIAGRIIPAIATTTAAIAGLASLELLKVIAKQPADKLKNCFLNLALPMMVLSEPGPPPKTKIRDGLEFSMWDRWDVHGHKDFKLQELIQYFQDKYGLRISMVCEGVRMIYMPVMPGHKKRVKDTMVKLLKPSATTLYTDIIVAFEPDTLDAEDDLPAPPVRYFYYS